MVRLDDSESIDDEPISKSSKSSKKQYDEEDTDCNDDLISMLGKFLGNLQWKVSILLFFIGVILFSDVFQDNVLAHISGATEGETVTTSGTFIQLGALIVGYNLSDQLVRNHYL